MICILEPKLDQALSGNFLYNRELAGASHGKIERYILEPEAMEDFEQCDLLLLDSACLFLSEAHHLAKTGASGYLVHSLPDVTTDWIHPLASCSVVVASSKPIADRLEKVLPDQRVILCEPGVDSRIRTLQSQPREHDLLRLITVANIMPRKGFREAIDFLQGLEGQGLAFHWYIVGQPVPDRDFNGSPELDENYFEELIGALNNLGWEDTVSFVGSMGMEQQLRLYLNMDVMFFPSRREDFGLSLLEAAQLGLPVLTTDVGIARDLFQGDAEALVIPAPLDHRNEPEALAFLNRYVGLPKNVRRKREHPRLSRTWSKAAGDLVRFLRSMPESFRLFSAGTL